MNTLIWPYTGSNIISSNHCTIIGDNTGLDITIESNVVIIGDNVKNLNPEDNTDTIFIWKNVAIGKTLFGKPSPIYDFVMNYKPETK